MTLLRTAVVGLGKIAREQHLPAIAATQGIELAAVASRNANLPGVPHFNTLDDLLRGAPDVEAVALCTPPQVRSTQAASALAAGKHVLLEKPPGATVSELAPLIARAAERGRALFATWHSRFAPAVDPARRWLAPRRLKSVQINWKEDVRLWHPGQNWIFEPGGLGVFDPAINALSILTRILSQPVFVTEAELSFPSNRDAPIAATVSLSNLEGVRIAAQFDFRQSGPQSWDIIVETDEGTLMVSDGGARGALDGKVMRQEQQPEYRGVYRRFVTLAAAGQSDVDLTPLQLVADAFLLGRRRVVEAFVD
jgi:D-galactose 1-dehydrogenase